MSRVLDLAELSGRCIVIGEIAQAHDGSLGFAHAYIDAVADAGADAVKFQTHIAHAESTPGEPWRIKFSRQDESRFDYWRRMEFTEDQWHGLKRHADERELMFLSSPFSDEAVELLERVGVAAWKVASGEVRNPVLLRRLAQTGRPVLVSSGMSSYQDLEKAVDCVRDSGGEVALFQCTSSYPTPPEMVGLNVLGELRERFGCHVGLSDHSGTVYPGLAAATLGASLLEVHVTMSREMFGPDVVASITTDELRTLVDGVKAISRMRGNPVDKDAVARDMSQMRETFGRSLFVRGDLPAGHTLGASDIALKKPGNGIPAEQRDAYIGRVLARDLATDHLLSDSDLQPTGDNQ